MFFTCPRCNKLIEYKRDPDTYRLIKPRQCSLCNAQIFHRYKIKRDIHESQSKLF
jgi:hypothetical protein